MKATLAAAENGDGPVQTEDQIVGEMVSKKSTVVLHGNNRAFTDSGSIHDQASQNTTFREEFNIVIEEQRTKLVEYENEMKAQDEKIESQRRVVEEQESTILELQSQQAATTKVITDMRGEMNRIFRLLALRRNAGTGILVRPRFSPLGIISASDFIIKYFTAAYLAGDGDPTISENV